MLAQVAYVVDDPGIALSRNFNQSHDEAVIVV
jgi:hypothetical protein